jgi:aryl-alcohol dehydrogenase-like predicted oxidoreductase
MSITPSYATETGTRRYAERFGHLSPDHFRHRYGLYMSSIGLGTYLGAPNPAASAGYVESIKLALQYGCNVIDTAVNYRYTQSEQDVGRALTELFAAGTVQRDEVIVCTKGGFVPFDTAQMADPAESIRARFYETGITQPMELVGNAHCIAPAYLSDQISLSLANLGLQTIDVYYLHNPETQLDYVTPEEFRKRIRSAFERLEEEAAAGRIRFYGIATWDGLRAGHTDRRFLPLPLFMQTAREVGGEKHRFRFLQFPYNLGMLEAVTDNNQFFEGERNGQEERLSLPLIAAARQYAMVAVGSAALHQRQLLAQLPPVIKETLGTFETNAQYAIHFNRSTPGLTTTLVGMGSPAHVVENLAVTHTPTLEAQAFFRLFERGNA